MADVRFAAFLESAHGRGFASERFPVAGIAAEASGQRSFGPTPKLRRNCAFQALGRRHGAGSDWAKQRDRDTLAEPG